LLQAAAMQQAAPSRCASAAAPPPRRCRAARAPRCAAQHATTDSAAAPAQRSRRALLHAGAAAAAAATLTAPRHAWAAAEDALTSAGADASAVASAAPSALEELFTAPQLYWPGPSLSYGKQLYYPDWLFGEWRVTSRLVAFTTPRGARFVPARAAAAAAEDLAAPPLAFAARFYSTLPDSRENALRVALGLLPRDAIMADRAFNTRSLTDATLAASVRPGGPPAARVASVEYDPRDAPDTLRVSYADDGTAPARAELFLSAMRTDALPDHSFSEPRVFRTAECVRQTTVAGRTVDVRDFQILSRFERVGNDGDGNEVAMRQRVGVFLTPQATLYFEAASVAVALYDYEMRLTRVATLAQGGQPLVCVETPKDVTQCR
jgi:hypothetical protein